jgi:cyclic pyranopterin phosphate synthase
MSHPFCADCTRLRLDARGRLRRCLMDPQPFPLVDGLRRGNTDEVRGSLSAYLAGKRPPTTMGSELPMAAVGG